MTGQNEAEPQPLLTDDGELIEPLPVPDAEPAQDDKLKHKSLPENRLFIPRWQQRVGAVIRGPIGSLLIATFLLLLLTQSGTVRCLLLVGVVVLFMGVALINSDGAASFGPDGVIGRDKERSRIAIAQEKDRSALRH